jgi:hypothetical protein
VASQWSKGGQPEVLRWLHETDATAVYRSRIQPLLEKRLREVGFVGAVGVDAYIYRGVDGQLRLEPVCEVNPRMTMGRVALGMRSKVSPGRSGRLQVWTKRTLKENGWASFQAMIDQSPAPQLDERGFLQRGTVVLNDPKEVRMALAVFEVF